MKELPESKTYLEEYKYMSWGKVVDRVISEVVQSAPQGGRVLDAMCGPGYILGKISEKRPDLLTVGIDISLDYITHASIHFPKPIYFVDDVMTRLPNIVKSKKLFDVVICTGGVHHIPYDKQDQLIEGLASATKRDGACIIADPVIGSYNTERQRKLAASELGSWYLQNVIKAGAPDNIVRTAIDIMYNDVLADGEFKDSFDNLDRKYSQHFAKVMGLLLNGPSLTGPARLVARILNMGCGDAIFYCGH